MAAIRHQTIRRTLADCGVAERHRRIWLGFQFYCPLRRRLAAVARGGSYRFGGNGSRGGMPLRGRGLSSAAMAWVRAGYSTSVRRLVIGIPTAPRGGIIRHL
jgi:hypothetical protein